MIKLLFLHLSILFFFTACSNYNDIEHIPSVEGDIQDSTTWYDDMVDGVLSMRVIIPSPNDFNCTDANDTNGTLRPCTLVDVNNDIDANDDYEPLLHVNFQTDDFPSNPDFMNASFQQKGKTTRRADQKSYRIKLDDNVSLYRGERTFQLGKHPYDYSRVRNKLAFDLFRTIPHITSLKTEFVDLDINSSEFNSSDYALFTHVEKVGKEFLINRGWNEDDNLWKAQNFAFFKYEQLKIASNGDPVDPEAFDTILEIERGKDQTKLDEMLSAVNNSKINFEETFSKYFNRSNYLTWMAANIIMGNKDTTSQNFYLYSPLYSNTFYFLPWDYDGAGLDPERYVKWEKGYAAWWQVPLHKRFLAIEQNRDDLDAMIKNLRENYITPQIIQEKLDIYEPLVAPYMLRLPDGGIYGEYERWYKDFNTLIPRIDENIAGYESQIGHPMPFWQSAVYEENKRLRLNWGRSVDFEGDILAYDLKISRSPDMNNSIIDETLKDEPTADINNIYYDIDIDLSPGLYYMKVTAYEVNNPEHYQVGFEKLILENGDIEAGILEFEVK